jgi:hypothetical protein
MGVETKLPMRAFAWFRWMLACHEESINMIEAPEEHYGEKFKVVFAVIRNCLPRS